MNKPAVTKFLPFLVAVAGCLILSFFIQFNRLPPDDTATRYAPMARAFAEGNWLYAFHPHSGVGFSTMAGSFAWLGMDGYRACQYAALLFWGSSAVVFYFLALRLWHTPRIALIAEILYQFCSHLQRMVYDGLRDNGRSLGIFLVVLSLLWFYEERNQWKPAICMSVGAALLSMLRVDGGLFAGAGILCFIIFDISNHGWKVGRSAVLTILFLLLIAPQLYLNYRWSGYPVLNSRYALILEKIGMPPLGRGVQL